MSQKQLTKFDIIHQKVKDNYQKDYKHWSPKRVCQHLIEAGRQRVLYGTQYDFPAYCGFPYKNYEKHKMDVNTLPFKYSDPDAPMKVLYLQEGKLAFWDMWKEYHEYLQEVINRISNLYPKRPKPPTNANQPNGNANQQVVRYVQQTDGVSIPIAGIVVAPDATSPNAPPPSPLHGSSVQPPDKTLGQMVPLAQSTPQRPGTSTATIASTVPAATTTPSRVPDQQQQQQPIIDFGGDDEDAIFDNVDVDLPSAIQDALAKNQSLMNADTRQSLQRISDSLNNPQNDGSGGAQLVTPDPNGPQNDDDDGVQPEVLDPNENEPVQDQDPNGPRRRPRSPRGPRRPRRRQLRHRNPNELGQHLHADDNVAMVNLENFQALDLAILEDALPQGPTPTETDAPNVQPQIDLNDGIEVPPVQPGGPDPNVVPNENQSNEQQAQQQQQLQEEQQAQQQQQQDQQQSIEYAQQDPVTVSITRVPDDQQQQQQQQQIDTIQGDLGISTNQNQNQTSVPSVGENQQSLSGVRSRARQRDPLKLAISKLGRIRKRPKPRKPINLDASEIQQYLLDDDNPNVNVIRKLELDYKFYALLDLPDPDFTKYYQRILQMVCVADFVDFDQYIDPQWTWYERACAISALTEFASEDFVRIKTKVVDGKVNKEIAGFYLPTD